MEDQSQQRKQYPRSEAPEVTVLLGGGQEARQDLYGRVLCSAHRRDGKLCKSPAVKGLKVCRMHGAGAPQVRNAAKLRLQELVNPAIATLAREMTTADKSADKQRAANSILDRAGFGRASRVEVEDAKDQLYQKLLEYAEDNQAIEEDLEAATNPDYNPVTTDADLSAQEEE